MLRVAAGDQRAFAEVYGRHESVALSVARGLCGVHAEDVVQDVFLRLWRAPGGFDAARGGLRTYVLMKVRGRAIDVLRSAASRRDREHLTEVARLRGADADLADARAEDVVTATLLTVLTPDQREAIVLAYFGGHTYREVAALLERPEGTVKGHISAGLRRLRRAIDEDDAARSGDP